MGVSEAGWLIIDEVERRGFDSRGVSFATAGAGGVVIGAEGAGETLADWVISMRALVSGWATARLFSLVGTAVSVLVFVGVLFQVY